MNKEKLELEIKVFSKMYFIVSDKKQVIFQTFNLVEILKFYFFLKVSDLLCFLGILTRRKTLYTETYKLVRGVKKAALLTDSSVEGFIENFHQMAKELQNREQE